MNLVFGINVTYICYEDRHTVYNMEVADYHTYYVGEDGVWVHNIHECITSGGGLSKGVHEVDSKASEITNPVIENIRTGSVLKDDPSHAFNNIIDNCVGDATKKGQDELLPD